jgi:hypothetical protein
MPVACAWPWTTSYRTFVRSGVSTKPGASSYRASADAKDDPRGALAPPPQRPRVTLRLAWRGTRGLPPSSVLHFQFEANGRRDFYTFPIVDRQHAASPRFARKIVGRRSNADSNRIRPLHRDRHDHRARTSGSGSERRSKRETSCSSKTEVSPSRMSVALGSKVIAVASSGKRADDADLAPGLVGDEARPPDPRRPSPVYGMTLRGSGEEAGPEREWARPPHIIVPCSSTRRLGAESQMVREGAA